MALEIEKKYLVETIPFDLSQFPRQEIMQGYLLSTPESSRRVRRKNDKFYFTEKSGKGIVRTENEYEITEEEFIKYWEETNHKRVSKTRYLIPHDKYTIELDIYHEKLAGLLTAEVEFPDEKEAMEFVPPEWFGKDVSTEAEYRNSVLAEKGLPTGFSLL